MSSAYEMEIFEDVSNPLDSIEDILTDHDWMFTRLHDDELSVTASGRLGNYALTFIWQEEFSALQFFCEFDMEIPTERMDMSAKVLRTINERLWLGHFDVPEPKKAPCFRHTSLFRGWTQTSGAEHMEDLIEIALAECERYHNVFNMLASSLYLTDEMIEFMLSEGAGEA